MELIDGIPLEEHLNNLKDKNEIFAEERIWKILMQVSKSEWLLNEKKKNNDLQNTTLKN
jgi:hypothetical protein